MKKTIILMGILCGLNAAAQDWSLTGNAGTTGVNFIGTTDAKTLLFRTNNANRLIMESNGNFTFITGNINFNSSEIFFNSPISTNAYSISRNVTKVFKKYYFNLDTTNDNENLFLMQDGGKVTVGLTATPNCLDCSAYNLFVKNGIRTEKIKVDIAEDNGWADYVFAKDYKLMPLKEVENFINTNGHLPEVPSTQEAIQNGIELKEMNILLLKKVEELTLHLIEQDKRIEKQEEQIKLLKSSK